MIWSGIEDMDMDKVYQVYVVKNRGKDDEERLFLGCTRHKFLTACVIRDYVAEGWDYGYVKQGSDTVGYYNQSSFLKSV